MKKLLSSFVFLFMFLISFAQQRQYDAFQGTASGTNSYTVTIKAVTDAAPYDGQTIKVTFTNANTSTATLKVLGAGTISYTARAIQLNGAAIASGDITASVPIQLTYVSSVPAWSMTKAGSSGTDWKTTGNTGTVDGTNFLGNTDNVPLSFRVDNIASGKISKNENNTFLGYQSGLSQTLGTTNSFYGSQSGRFLTIGTENAAMGTGALTNNLAGNGNSAFGMQALRDATGDYNTSIGHESLLILTSGSYNVALGKYAGRFTTSSASRNIFLGARAGMYETRSDKGYINNSDRTNLRGDTTKSVAYWRMGTDSSDQAWTFNGKLRINDGTQTDGDIFTYSSSTGFGSWAALPASGWALVGNALTGTEHSPTEFFGSTNNFDVVFKENNSEVMRVTDNHLAIGYSGSNPTDNVTLIAQGAGGSTGNVILGQWDSDPTYGLISLNGTAAGATDYNFLSKQGDQHLYVNANAGINLRYGGANRMLINNTNVETSSGIALGVGVTPTAKFHVVGDGATSATSTGLFENSAGTDLFDIKDNGLIYAGVATNISIGLNAGYRSTTSGNTFLGIQVGGAINSDAAVANTGLGYQALTSITSGSYNTAHGALALAGVTTGINNTATGYSALDVINAGNNNAAYGYNTLGSANGALGNSAFGTEAGTAITDGDYNTPVGYQALLTASSGNENTALGYQAGALTTTGGINVFLGAHAGAYQTTASNNLFIHNQNTGSTAEDLIESLVYGNFASTPQNQLFRVNGNLQVGDSANFSVLNKVINTTAGDGATINANAGRIRKDASGTTFTLTNNKITANSIILLQVITPALTGGKYLTPQAGSGSVVITFEDETTGVATAPSANMDINFFIIN